ncbi:MAG: hypothetical protein AABX03_05130 [Nanoarchaeota archaeon]
MKITETNEEIREGYVGCETTLDMVERKGEISDIIESIEIESISDANQRVIIIGSHGHYIIIPEGCKIRNYSLKENSPTNERRRKEGPQNQDYDDVERIGFGPKIEIKIFFEEQKSKYPQFYKKR